MTWRSWQPEAGKVCRWPRTPLPLPGGRAHTARDLHFPPFLHVDLRDPLQQLRIYPGGVHRLISECVHLSDATGPLDKRSQAIILPELQVPDSMVPKSAADFLAFAAG